MIPETYSPVLLRRRAIKLEKETGKVYRSMYDLHPGFGAPLTTKMQVALSRPFVLLFREPICFLFAVYSSLVYGMLCKQRNPLLFNRRVDRKLMFRPPSSFLAARRYSCDRTRRLLRRLPPSL